MTKRKREKALELLTVIEHEVLNSLIVTTDLREYLSTDELNKFIDYMLVQHDLKEEKLI